MLFTKIFDHLKPRTTGGPWLTGGVPLREVETRYGILPVGRGEPLVEEEARYRPLPLGEPVPIGLPDPELYPIPDMGPVISPQTDLAAAPEVGEWFKKNRVLVIGAVIALILLFLFLRKGKRRR